MINAVTVYCSARNALDARFYAAGTALGRALAGEGWTLVYGGNALGIMKSVADGVRSAGGKVIGVTPQLFIDQNVHDTQCDELIVTQTMRQRKQLMEQHGDAFIAAPGGLGTFEELFEIIVGRQLEYHNKPIVLLNIDGYWNPMLAMLDHAIALSFIRETARALYYVASDVADALRFLRDPAVPPPSATPGPGALPSAIE